MGKHSLLVVLTPFLSLFVGCSSDKRIVPDQAVLDSYHLACLNEDSIAPAKEMGQDLYLDYSGSMARAVAETYDLLEGVIRILDVGGSKAYIVGDALYPAKFAEIATEEDSKYYAKDLENYHQWRSRLDLAVKEIQRLDREAIFVTDFLLQDGKSHTEPDCDDNEVSVNFNSSAWARPMFEDWLCHGNGITILSTPVQLNDSTNVSKHPRVFYLLFWKKGQDGDKSMRSRVLREAQSNTKRYDVLELSNTNFRVGVDIPGGTKKNRQGLGSNLESSRQWNNDTNRYSYVELSRTRMLRALDLDEFREQKTVLTNVYFRDNVRNVEPPKFWMKCYDITKPFSDWIGDSGTGKSTPLAASGGNSILSGKVMESLFKLNPERDDSNRTEFRILLPKPKSLAPRRILFRIEVGMEERQIPWNDSEYGRILKWEFDDDKCVEMKVLHDCLKEAVVRCPVQRHLLWTYYVEIAD